MVHKLPKVPLRAGRWPCPVIGENELEAMTEAHAREGEELEVASDRRALGGIHHGSSPYRPRRLGRRALVSRASPNSPPHLTRPKHPARRTSPKPRYSYSAPAGGTTSY